MRVFFGVFFPESLRARLEVLRDDLKRSASGGSVRWTGDDQLHLTLQFLGNVAADRVGTARELARVVAARTAPFTVSLGGLGAFPLAARPRVLWVGVREGAPLVALADDLGRELRAAGFELEDRAYHPHVTLARIKDRRDERAVARAMDRDAEIGPLVVERFALIESKTAPRGSVYGEVEAFALQKPNDQPSESPP